MTTQDIVQKLWGLCHILRDDGITYHQYVTELTFLLFLKMAKEQGEPEKQIPEEYRWDSLKAKTGIEQRDFYRKLLIELGKSSNKRIQNIYNNASTSLKTPKHLSQLIASIDSLEWFDVSQEGLGDLYEGLLQKNANEVKSGAGQYFTPRPLIDSIVSLIKPKAGERIQDPAAGTCGFLIAADRYIKVQTDDLFTLSEKLQTFQREAAFYGVELVPETQRLALMNLMLHGIDADLQLGDTLTSLGAGLRKADVILSNPPFGTKKGGGGPTRDDLTYLTSNKQLNFLQHIYRGLVPGGRAAVIVPDNVLFEDNAGASIRTDLMEKCNLHTILRLPTGIFYAQGVKTNVLFFTRGKSDKNNTQSVWIYDARTNAPSFGKRTPLTRGYFADFEAKYGEKPDGSSARHDEGETGRWRCFTREVIKERGDNLDITWLRDEKHTDPNSLPAPEIIAADILSKLQEATREITSLIEKMGS
jgi:type I restriction enzyme M protein